MAFKRFTDNVRSAFQMILIEAIAKQALEALSMELAVYEEDASKKAKDFLQEDPNIVHVRADKKLPCHKVLRSSMLSPQALYESTLMYRLPRDTCRLAPLSLSTTMRLITPHHFPFFHSSDSNA